MKKIVCILFSLTVLVASIFADKSRFYENGKVIDTMYVNSEDGLKVRDYPSLKSNRLCGLQHRLPVKVVAIGKDATIDGITAPWVEILIPRYEWKGSEAEYGWVFCGYLAKEEPKTFAVPKTKEQLEFYLKTRLIALSDYHSSDDYIKYVRIKENHIFFKTSPNCDWGGEFTVLSGKEFKYTHTDENLNRYKPLDYYDVRFIITDISESTFKTKVVGKNFETSCIWNCDVRNYETKNRGINEQIYFVSPSLYFISFFSKIDKIFSGYTDSVYCDFNEKKDVRLSKNEFVEELIKSGVSAKGTEYEQQYHDYWNPIMEQHQKKADEMK